MNISMEKVTPALAREWLKFNTNNRNPRLRHVESLRSAFLRGEYRFSHQGIAFSVDGDLLDGQHRLMAISGLPEDWSCEMVVARGLDRAESFPVIDVEIHKRNVSDVLGLTRKHADAANFLARVYAGRVDAVTPSYAEPFAAWCEPLHFELDAFCSTTRKTWSSAPVRAAAFISMSNSHDHDYVKVVYRALVHADFASMPPIAHALYRSHLSGKVRASAAGDIFCRCIKAFDPSKSDLSKIQISSTSETFKEVRDHLDRLVFGKNKWAAPSPAAALKSVSKRNYRTA